MMQSKTTQSASHGAIGKTVKDGIKMAIKPSHKGRDAGALPPKTNTNGFMSNNARTKTMGDK